MEWQMNVLRAIAEIRNPFLDTFFGLITHLGSEIGLIVLALIFFWCIDKRQGYYLFAVGFVGTILNQFLKLTFRVPRPWVYDPTFEAIESAKADAGGFSFPSGHTQSSVGLFGGIARSDKKKWLRYLCLVPCLLVPFSRMYLGVHTPADVGVSVLIALSLVFLLYIHHLHLLEFFQLLFHNLLSPALVLLYNNLQFFHGISHLLRLFLGYHLHNDVL